MSNTVISAPVNAFAFGGATGYSMRQAYLATLAMRLGIVTPVVSLNSGQCSAGITTCNNRLTRWQQAAAKAAPVAVPPATAHQLAALAGFAQAFGIAVPVPAHWLHANALLIQAAKAASLSQVRQAHAAYLLAVTPA